MFFFSVDLLFSIRRTIERQHTSCVRSQYSTALTFASFLALTQKATSQHLMCADASLIYISTFNSQSQNDSVAVSAMTAAMMMAMMMMTMSLVASAIQWCVHARRTPHRMQTERIRYESNNP